jgi:hypothetical protein
LPGAHAGLVARGLGSRWQVQAELGTGAPQYVRRQPMTYLRPT